MRELDEVSAWKLALLFLLLVTLLLLTAPFAFASWLRWHVHHYRRVCRRLHTERSLTPRIREGHDARAIDKPGVLP